MNLRAAQVAAGLKDLGVEPGDRIAIVLRNDFAFLETSGAAAIAGAAPVPVNWHWKDHELAHLLRDSGSKVVFAHTDFVPGVEAVLPEGVTIIEVGIAPDLLDAYGLAAAAGTPTGRHPEYEDWLASYQPLLEAPTTAAMSVIYTSGTTGRPKGIIREASSAEERIAGVGIIMNRLGMKWGSRTMVPAPMYHTAPNVHALMAFALGMDLVVLPRFDPEEFLRIIEAHKVDHIQMVPTMFVRLLQLPEEVRKRYDLSSLDTVVHAAAPCPVDVKRQMIEWFGPVITEYYGGSETGPVVWCDSEEWLAHPGTVGHPCDGAIIKIVDDDGNEVPTGEVGTVYAKPGDAWPNFTYLGDDEKRRNMELDGYLTVGDVGRVDEDGYLYLTDRASNMIISGGVNIYPREAEDVLVVHPLVADVAVIGTPDDVMGEQVTAFVQLLDPSGASDELGAELIGYTRERLTHFKCPREVRFVDSLPRLPNGKLLKRNLLTDVPHRFGPAG
jgi:long-chain acyl-CoA synthetase